MECSRWSAKTYQNTTVWLLSVETYQVELTQLISPKSIRNTQSGFRRVTAYSSLMTAAAVFDNRQAIRVCTNSSYGILEWVIDDPITISDSCEVLSGIPLISQPQPLLSWSQLEHNQQCFKVVCNASPYLDAEMAETECRNHVVDVFSSVFPATNPCASRPVANLDSCLICEQHTPPNSGAISLGPF